MDPLLAAKLLLTPLLIGLISLAARSFGPRVGGALAGLPWTSSAVSIFLALEHGAQFAQDAAWGTEAAVPAVVVFCSVYALFARRGWFVSLPLAVLAFLAAVFVAVRFWSPSILEGFLVSIAVLLVAIATFPRRTPTTSRAPAPVWEIPLRMFAATVLVLALTGFAKALGPDWTGALSPFPVFASVLGTFIHHRDGPDAARRFLWGVMMGLISFATFFLIVGTSLVPWGLFATYLIAAGAALGASFVAWIAWLRLRTPQPAAV